MELFFVLGYILIAFVVACIVTYKKGCDRKKRGGYFSFRVADDWHCRQVFGSLFWPGWVLLVLLKVPYAFFNYLEALGQKHGCGK